MPSVTRPRRRPLLATLTLIIACQGDRSVGPVPEDTGLEPSGECSSRCTIASGDLPLAAARYLPDSTAWPVYLAEVLVRGRPGAELSLRLKASEALAKAFHDQGNVLVTIGTRPTLTVPLAALSEPVRVFRFESEDTVRVRYYLARDMREYPNGGFELVQDVVGGAVLTSHRPFVRPVRTALALAPLGTCPVGGSSFGSVCGIPFNISPWAAADHFGATFQSNPGSGESSPITVVFSLSVKSVTVTIYDPDFSGNLAAAYGVNGVPLGQVGFTGDGTPGTLTTETQTLSAPGIRRIELIPASADYVAYDMNIVPDSTCEPKWADPWLKDPEVQQGMNSRWQTEWDKGFDRKEPGAWIMEDLATGEYEMVPGDFTHQDQCEITLVPTPPSIPGKEAKAWWHGHVLTPSLPVPLDCRNVAPGEVVENGLSNKDLNFARESGYPGYGLDENELFKVNTDGSTDKMPWTKQNYCRP
jgi:hypothetical protein